MDKKVSYRLVTHTSIQYLPALHYYYHISDTCYSIFIFYYSCSILIDCYAAYEGLNFIVYLLYTNVQ